MGKAIRFLLPGLPVLALLLYVVFSDPSTDVARTARAADNPPKPSSGPPPLIIDLSNIPRLKGPGDEPDESDAINGDCYVCHENYREEPLVQRHAKEKIGCKDCHGESSKHQEDEFHETPPDIMYPRERIDPKCAKCHDEHDVPAIKVIACFQKRSLAHTEEKGIVCTDCHGQHRLQRRSYRWDKKSGKLLPADASGDRIIPSPPKDPDPGLQGQAEVPREDRGADAGP
jgi:hypothetical protein